MYYRLVIDRSCSQNLQMRFVQKVTLDVTIDTLDYSVLSTVTYSVTQLLHAFLKFSGTESTVFQLRMRCFDILSV